MRTERPQSTTREAAVGKMLERVRVQDFKVPWWLRFRDGFFDNLKLTFCRLCTVCLATVRIADLFLRDHAVNHLCLHYFIIKLDSREPPMLIYNSYLVHAQQNRGPRYLTSKLTSDIFSRADVFCCVM